jgi:hypothetical protein
MGSGRNWGKGSEKQYLAVEEMFNNAAKSDEGRKALVDFAEAIRTSPKSVIELQQDYLGAYGGNPESDDPDAHYDPLAVANGWYGATPIWRRDSKNRPAEIEKVMRETRRWLALLLARGTDDRPRTCSWYTQCYHLEFETRITWPRSGITDGTEFRVWVFTPENLTRGSSDDTSTRVLAAASSAAGSAHPTTNSFVTSISTLSRALNEAEREYRELVAQWKPAYSVASVGAAAYPEPELDRRDDEPHLRDLETTIMRLNKELEGAAETASEVLPPRTHLYRCTRMAVGPDLGLPLIGGVEVSDLDDVLHGGGREHLLHQPPEDRNDPLGPSAYGVRFRWERTAPVPYIDFNPTNISTT